MRLHYDLAPMSERSSLTVLILTANEAIHIERCVSSAKRVADEILVVDSYSTDDTTARARRLGARVLENGWVNHATQINWALRNGNIRSEWVMRLDADEFLEDQLVGCLKDQLSGAARDTGGFEVNRRILFMGREIRHGGMAPMWVTRVWRNGWAECEDRWMDEHMVLTRGKIARLGGAVVDENLNNLTWWTQKHNLYSNREAIELLRMRHSRENTGGIPAGLNWQAQRKRGLKTYVYTHIPLGLRPWMYFIYRLVFRLGVLDGSRGVMFHCLQGLWYRLLVDGKVAEVERDMSNNNCDLNESIRRVLGIEVEA